MLAAPSLLAAGLAGFADRPSAGAHTAMDNIGMMVDHYENFPVASVLCPRHLRPAVRAVYAFARTADDLADEGDISATQRLESLAAYRNDLHATVAGRPASLRWPSVFTHLGKAIQRHNLPIDQLDALLDAFVQDVSVVRYGDRSELLAYCRRSANPVGRLMLCLHGIDDAPSLRRSDAICTALQLANFWQDFGEDADRGRIYAPQADCIRHHVDSAQVLARHDDTNSRALVLDLAGWARESMLAGAPLVHALPGRAGWELRLVVQGGLRVLERIERMGGATLGQRPIIGWPDAPVMAWRALCMKRTAGLRDAQQQTGVT